MTQRQDINRFFDDKQTYQWLLRKCRRLFDDDALAEDALQDVFIKIADSAETIDFPKDRRDALCYVERAIYHHLVSTTRKSKRLPEFTDEQEALNVPDDADINPSVVQKLEKLDLLIMENCEKFTAEQLKLWNCLCELRSVSEMERILGKKRQTIYSLRNKLLAKIGKLFNYEELC